MTTDSKLLNITIEGSGLNLKISAAIADPIAPDLLELIAMRLRKMQEAEAETAEPQP